MKVQSSPADAQASGEPVPSIVVDQPADATVPPTAPATAPWPVWPSAIDGVLAFLAIAVAFLAASHIARNNDQWLHLAVGRHLAEGTYSFGTDPFSFATAEQTWVNHSWLYSLGAYLLYQADTTGGAMVLVKAIAFAAIFVILLLMRKPGTALWPWVVGVTLAVVAAAPQAQLRPIVASGVMLAITLFILFATEWKPDSKRNPIALAVVFGVWANLDAWFILGPLCVLLLLVGEYLEGLLTKTANAAAGWPRKSLLLALGFGVVACMLNPHHVRVWQIPQELGVGVAPAVKTDIQFLFSNLSPTSPMYYERADIGYNVNGLAFAILLLGGGAVVGLAFGRLRVGQVLLWIAFAALALRQYQLIFYFAIAAVPLLASALVALTHTLTLGGRFDPRTSFLLLIAGVGRIFGLLALLMFAGAAYPGWLHPKSGDPSLARYFGWGVEPDAGFARTATMLNDWRESGRLPDDYKGLVLNPELANHIAWFAPREKVFANGRYGFHMPQLTDWVKVRKQILDWSTPNDPREVDLVREICRRHEISYVVYTNMRSAPSAVELAPVFVLTGSQDPGFNLWHADGRAVILGNRESSHGSEPAFAQLAFDPVALAFRPDQTPLEAPVKAVPPTPPAMEWLDAYFVPPPKPVPVEGLDALNWYELGAQAYSLQTRRHEYAWRLAIGATSTPVFGQMMLGDLRQPPAPNDQAVAFQLLAIRAARKAIAKNPDYPESYLVLSQAAGPGPGALPGTSAADGREQQVAGLRRFLARLPKPDQTNNLGTTQVAFNFSRTLAQQYAQMNIFDLAQQTFRQSRDYLQRGANIRPDLMEPATKMLKEMEQQLEAIDENLAKVNDAYEQFLNTRPDTNVAISRAIQLGLYGRAINTYETAIAEKKDLGPNPFEVLGQMTSVYLTVGNVEEGGNMIEFLEEKQKELLADPKSSKQLLEIIGQAIAQLQEQYWRLNGDYAKLGERIEAELSRRQALNPVADKIVRAAIAPNTQAGFVAVMGALPHMAIGGAAVRLTEGELGMNVLSYWETQALRFQARARTALLEGNIPNAKARYEQSLTPDGIPLPEFHPVRRTSQRYLDLISQAKSHTPPPALVAP